MRRAAALITLAATLGCGAHASPQNPSADHRPSAASQRAVRDLRVQLDTVFNAPVTQRGVWGVEVRSLDRGDTLYSMNAGKLMMPASNMKILTLASAAEVLGWDFTYKTTLETSAAVEGHTLKGDLIVRGTGDPTIGTRGDRGRAVFDGWASSLRAAGITAIEGRIVGDDQAFDDEVVGPGWSWDYLEAGYAAPIGALQYNENAADLTIAAGTAVGDPAVIRLASGSGLTVVNRVTTTDATRARSPIDVHRRIDRPELEISGTVPVDAPPTTRTVAVINPTLFFAESLKQALIERGIPVSGEALDGDDIGLAAAERRVLATATSAPLREIATVLMKVSQNQYAETLLKSVGAASGGLGTVAAGRRAVQAVFDRWGIPGDGYVIYDGSGLSRYNYAAPAVVTQILAHMQADPTHRDPFRATLPIAGKDGTIATRMRRSLAEGNAVAKTGSIANVRSLSGYVRTRGGETLAFSIIANDFVAPAATVNWIADLAVEILATFHR